MEIIVNNQFVRMWGEERERWVNGKNEGKRGKQVVSLMSPF